MSISDSLKDEISQIYNDMRDHCKVCNPFVAVLCNIDYTHFLFVWARPILNVSLLLVCSTAFTLFPPSLQVCRGLYKDSVVFQGRRCLETVGLFYDPVDKHIHVDHREGRIPLPFIQNSQKGVYINVGENTLEYSLDNTLNAYTLTRHHGLLSTTNTSIDSTRYRQCDAGLVLNTKSAALRPPEQRAPRIPRHY
jgi:hypothetical protein